VPGRCGKRMTEPDDGLKEALRQALSAAVDEVSPGTDGLSKIRARIGDSPPRRWLLSVLAGAAERARNWTWRGHWAWPSPLRWPAAFPAPRGRLASSPGLTRAGARSTGLRLGTALAGIAAIAAVSLGVQPFRQAIIEASSTVFDGGSGTSDGGSGAEGNGTHALSSSVADFTTAQAGQAAAAVVPGATRSRAAKSTQAELCVPATGKTTAMVATTTADDSTVALATAPPTRSPRSLGSVGAARPSYSGTAKTTCPVSGATVSGATVSGATVSGATVSGAAVPAAISPTPSVAPTSSAPLISDTTVTPAAVVATAGPSPSYAWQAPTQPPSWPPAARLPRHRQRPGRGRHGR
jgi:hypothetical protein